MLTFRRRMVALAHRLRYRTWRLRWVVLTLTLAIAGLVSIRFPPPGFVNVAVALLSAGLVAWDYSRYRKALATTEFQPRVTDSFVDVEAASRADDRFEFRSFANGSVLMDRHLSKLLRANEVSAHVRSDRYRPPVELRELGERYQETLHARSKTLFPGPMLGLASDLGQTMGDTVSRVDFQPGTYYEHVRSDLLATEEVIQDGRPRGDLGVRLFIDRHGRCRDFRDSWLFNGVGTSTIAFTIDGKLVTVSQSEANVDSAGLLAPAGSGALEPQDAGALTELPMRELVLNGAVRELAEESGVERHEIATSHSLGFGRWLDKAGRPEFYAVSFLTVDSHELGRRAISRSERGFVRRRRFDRLGASHARWAAEGMVAMLPRDALATMSVPLAACLALLADAVRDEWGPVTRELRARSIVD